MNKLVLLSVLTLALNSNAGVGGGGGGVRPGNSLFANNIKSDFVRFKQFNENAELVFYYKDYQSKEVIEVTNSVDQLNDGYLNALKDSAETNSWIKVNFED